MESVKVKYTIKSFIAMTGERISQLYNAEEGGFPLYYPTAYIARSIRPSCTHETQKVHLEAIKRVCEWEAYQKVDLVKRFQQHQFLKLNEVDALTNHLGARRKSNTKELISRNKYNTYLSYAASYLRWLADEVITETNIPHIRTAIDQQYKVLLKKSARKRGSVSARNQRIASLCLPENTRSVLLNLFDNPLKNVHRRTDEGSRIRNIMMLRILYDTGMRLGELLSLKLGSFQEARGGECGFIIIERNHHDILDSRIHQPVVKTLGRILPISTATEQLLIEYRDCWRAEVPKASFSEKSFLFINHRFGASQGSPVTTTSFNSALKNLKLLFSDLEPLHPHLLRHDWNYRFSEKIDKEGLDFNTERETREFLMGWCNNSAMSTVYNQRHIQEKANAIGLSIASDSMNPRQKNEK